MNTFKCKFTGHKTIPLRLLSTAPSLTVGAYYKLKLGRGLSKPKKPN